VKVNEVWNQKDIVTIMKEEDAAASEDSKPDKKVLIPRFTFSSETPK